MQGENDLGVVPQPSCLLSKIFLGVEWSSNRSELWDTATDLVRKHPEQAEYAILRADPQILRKWDPQRESQLTILDLAVEEPHDGFLKAILNTRPDLFSIRNGQGELPLDGMGVLYCPPRMVRMILEAMLKTDSNLETITNNPLTSLCSNWWEDIQAITQKDPTERDYFLTLLNDRFC